MGKLIRDEGRGVNFQKASCTLDASVKIYSNRVDDTHASSHRILESLSRNDGHFEAEEDDNEEAGEGTVKRAAKVGSKANSTRLNIESTIEKNVANINQASVEKGQAVDPSFHRMSKAFDEGGVKGMLMNNLRMRKDTSTLAFCTEEFLGTKADTKAPTTTPTYPTIFNLSQLLQGTGINADELTASLSLCPALDEYRDVLGCGPASLDDEMRAYLDWTPPAAVASTYSRGPSYSNVVRENTAETYADYSPPDYDGGDDDNQYDDGPMDYNDAGGETVDETPYTASAENDGHATANETDDWLPTGQAPSVASPARHGTSTELVVDPEGEEVVGYQPQQIDIVPVQSDYSYFNIQDTMNKQNSWAGAKHWKFGGKLRSAAAKTSAKKSGDKDADENQDPQVPATATKKGRSKGSKNKESDYIEFGEDNWPSRDAFAVPKVGKTKTDVTVQTAYTLEKQLQQALEGALDLPPDAKLQVKDLCRLFLCPTLIVPPTRSGYGQLLSSQMTGEVKPLSHVTERVWGSSSAVVRGKKVATAGRKSILLTQSAASGMEHGYNYNTYDDGDDGGGDDYAPMDYDATDYAPAPSTGLAINTDGLLKATRTVEKVDIGYATVSTKVNVRKLKSDIWAHIHQSAKGNRRDSTGVENDVPSVGKSTGKSGMKTEPISFKALIETVSDTQEQKGASLPFYFICLLHLANEKVRRHVYILLFRVSIDTKHPTQ